MKVTNVKSTAYQLGVLIGEYIIDHYLPTLSCDDFKTRHVIDVSEEEASKVKMLTDVWFKKTNDRANSELTHRMRLNLAKEEWDSLRSYHDGLIKKYIPEVLECGIPLIYSPDMDVDGMKEGIIDSLWNSDCCYYAIETNDDVELDYSDNEIFNKTTITLKRG